MTTENNRNNRILVVMDMQNDFINGALGTFEAVKIVPNVEEKIKSWDGDIVYTLDTHNQFYKETEESKLYPKHCIEYTYGWDLNPLIRKALNEHEKIMDEKYELPLPIDLPLIPLRKSYFGSSFLTTRILNMGVKFYEYYVEFVGLCTDICAIMNVMHAKTEHPEWHIAVDASCCAGSTPELHEAALKIMHNCGIEILNWKE